MAHGYPQLRIELAALMQLVRQELAADSLIAGTHHYSAAIIAAVFPYKLMLVEARDLGMGAELMNGHVQQIGIIS